MSSEAKSTEIMEKKKGLRGWTTRDLLVTAVIGIVFGLLISVVVNFGLVLWAATTPLVAVAVFNGAFVMSGMTAPYLIRRPGASIISELITGLAMSPFTAFGIGAIVGRLMEGIVYEIPFLATRYRRYGWVPMMLGGVIGGTAFFLMTMMVYGAQNLATGLLIGLVFINTVSCVLGVVLSRKMVEALVRSGVLSGLVLGQELQEEI
ncbi:MAG: ECF transporter S component [Chloroflexota bacterium]